MCYSRGRYPATDNPSPWGKAFLQNSAIILMRANPAGRGGGRGGRRTTDYTDYTDKKYYPIRAIREIRGHIPVLREGRGEPRITRLTRIKNTYPIRAIREIRGHIPALRGTRGEPRITVPSIQPPRTQLSATGMAVGSVPAAKTGATPRSGPRGTDWRTHTRRRNPPS